MDRFGTFYAHTRFESFTLKFLETDLWIGVDKISFKKEMADFALVCIEDIRAEIEEYAKRDKIFLKTLFPYEENSAPKLVTKMFECGKRAGVGPMATVAGILAQEVGRLIETTFNVKEIVVENGGDIYLNVKEAVVISVFAGSSSLSEKVGLKIEPKYSPLGICTSSGIVGHSFSFGKTDAVVVVCKDAGLADAYATSFCNKINSEKDIEPVLDKIKKVNKILGAVVIVKEQVGIRGIFPLEILKF